MNLRTEQTIYVVVLTAVTIAIMAFLWLRREPPAPATPEPAVEAPAIETEEPPEPRFPVGPPPEAVSDEATELVPLPPLDDSDSYFSMALGDLFGSQLDELLADEALIEKFVATVDNLPREKTAERLRPVSTPPGHFAVSEANGTDRYRLSEANYARYDALISMFVNTPSEQIVEGYRRFYPLLQEAYRNLGYPDAYFNDRLVEVIDHLLATPDPAAEPDLVRPHVLYEYADPALEGLSSGQKLLIRLGPAHEAAVKTKLAELRSALAAAGAADPQQ